MKSIKDKIKNAFSKSASTYDSAAEVQNLIADKLILKIPTKKFKNILEIGSGTGNYTEKLIKLNTSAKFTVIDFSDKMMLVAKKKLAHFPNNISFLTGDIEEIPNDLFPENYFDLITSNSTLQWINNLAQIFFQLYNNLSSAGFLIFSYYGKKTYWELHYVLNQYFSSNKLDIPAVKFDSIDNVKKGLIKLFPSIQIKEYKIIKEYSSLYALLTKIKHSGEYGYGLATNISLTKSKIKELEKIYINEFKKIVATYHYYVILAKK